MKKAQLIILLLLLNLLAHFLPFERASLAPDDYAALVRMGSVKGISSEIKVYSDRPLNYAVLSLQSKLVGDNAGAALILLFLSSSALLLGVFVLLERLFRNGIAAFIGSVVFCLMPNKLETYHTFIFFNVNTVFLVYVMALVFFIDYVDKGKSRYLAASLFLYAVGIFWYEVGFFAPVLMALYCLSEKKRRLRAVMPFVIISLVYIVYRISGAFGFAPGEGASHTVSFSMIPFNLKDLLHHYVGRYIIRSFVYGTYNFVRIQPAWLFVIAASTLVMAIFIARAIRKEELPSMSARTLITGLTIFIVFIAPILMNDKGGVGGRHLVLPSIGLSVIAVWLLQLFKSRWRAVFIAVVLVLTVISAGNAWTQVIACRINGGVYDYLKSQRTALQKADAVVFDTKSFADRIPYTLVERDFNILNTYFGAQAFEDWGLASMVRWLTGDSCKRVYVAVTEPVKGRDGGLEFRVFEYLGYRSKSKVPVVLADRDIFIVDFSKVFGGTR